MKCDCNGVAHGKNVFWEPKKNKSQEELSQGMKIKHVKIIPRKATAKEKEKEKSRIFAKDADSSGGACFHKYSTKVYWIFFEQIQKAGKLVNLLEVRDSVNNRW